MKQVMIFLMSMALMTAFSVRAADKLSDNELDSITAGTADVPADNLLEFSAQHQSKSGRTVKVDGAIDLDKVRTIDTASLLLSDNAQNNLRSLININAVQSSVNVLVNLNIMIDSHIGELHQLNLAPR